MKTAAIADALNQTTGTWQPFAAATPGDLELARTNLAAALASGISPESMHATPAFHAPSVDGGAAIEKIVHGVAPKKSTPTVLPRVRNLTDIDPALAASVAGMKVEKTLGPFIDAFGALHWIDLIPIPTKIPISSVTRGVIGYLIVANPSAKTLKAGSVWIATAALDIPLLATGAVGLSFFSGTAKVAGSVSITNSGIKIGAGGTLTLTLTLAPPAVPPGTPPIGADARAMTLSLPATVTIEFAEPGVAFTSIDDSSATVYGTSFSLKRNTAKPRGATAGLGYVLFPCDPSISEFGFTSVASTEVIPSGQGAVLAGGWALPITTVPPAQLGAASSAGSVLLELGTGILLLFGNLAKPALLAKTTLALSPGAITISTENGQRAVTDTLTLWRPVPSPPIVQPRPAQHDSEIDFTIPRGAIVFAIVSTSLEGCVAFGNARANVDRPLAANGMRLPIYFTSALVAFVRLSTGTYVIGEMSVPPPTAGPPPIWAIALENALLKTQPANSAVLVASYSGTQLVGFLELMFAGAEVIPILPDPYASGNVLPIELLGTVLVLDTWTTKPGARVNFWLVQAAQQPAGQQEVAVRVGPTLLDLSSNVDQFGVSIAVPHGVGSPVTLGGLAIGVPQNQLAVYTLPGISWEPVVDDSTKGWYDAPTTNDGPPTTLRANTVQLVPIQPDLALDEFAQAAADASTFGRFTLPFGLIATLETDPQGLNEPTFSLVKADFANQMTVSRQLSIQATGPLHTDVLRDSTPALPGSTTTGSPLPIDPSTITYGGMILSDTDPRLSATAFVEQQFSTQLNSLDPEIPVSRVDISGYGTSMFSEWANTDIKYSGVARARFDVLVGRTAYELVQIQTVVMPWTVRITETIIFERFDSGLVVRHDTGWKAVGDASFDVFTPNQVFLGAVQRLTNVHNIVPTGGASLTVNGTRPGGLEFVPVTFDADIVMQPSVTAITNGAIGKPVAARQILGYAQTTPGQGASAIETLLLTQQIPDGVSGLIGCILQVGPPLGGTPPPPQFTLNASSIAAKATSTLAPGQNYPAAVAVSVNGTPRLPRDGAWSITRRGQSDPAPTSVDPTSPIPLISVLDSSNNPQWRLLDPSDALSATNPSAVFGLLQGTGTSKTLFENPVVQASGQALSLDPAQGVPTPNLADIGALLGAADIFPALSNALQIPTVATDALALANDGFQKSFTWTLSKNNDGVTPLDDQKLLDLGIVSIVLQYQDTSTTPATLASATFTVDANPPAGQPRWSLEIKFLAMAVFVAGFGSDPLLTIHGGFKANELQKAGFTDIQVDYGSALSLIKNILTGISGIVNAIGGTVDLDVGFSDNKLTVRDGFALPTFPLGLGELENIAIDLGLAVEIPASAEFTVGFASKENPFTWIVDPLAGNGCIVLGTSGSDMSVFVEAGIGVALAIDVAVASGSASIILDFSFLLQPPDVKFCIALTGNASVDVLGGLASASLTLTASITVDIVPGPAADFTGAVAVGIHISIAWVISVDFDGTWSFEESVPLHALPV
jgi:hypothetical protein